MRALELAGGGDDTLGGFDGAAHGAQHVGDGALFGEGRERDRYSFDITSIYLSPVSP